MLLTKGKVASSEPWKILEVALGQSPDVLALRLAKELKRIHEPGIEALVPMKRNADGDPEWIVEHVYVRGANGSLGRLARTPGIDFIRPEAADSNWIAELLKYEHSVETMIDPGMFVRVLTGPCARMCGHVKANADGTVTVAIPMRTKLVTCYTYPENVQRVNAPPELQTFFFQSTLFSS